MREAIANVLRINLCTFYSHCSLSLVGVINKINTPLLIQHGSEINNKGESNYDLSLLSDRRLVVFTSSAKDIFLLTLKDIASSLSWCDIFHDIIIFTPFNSGFVRSTFLNLMKGREINFSLYIFSSFMHVDEICKVIACNKLISLHGDTNKTVRDISYGMSQREVDVTLLTLQGFNLGEISQKLKLSRKTICHYRMEGLSKIKGKLISEPVNYSWQLRKPKKFYHVIE